MVVLVPAQAHDGTLAYESYLLGTILCWASALLIALLCWKKRLPSYYLFVSASILARAVFSALLTISAGPDPYYNRAELAESIRITNIASNIAMSVWVFYLVKASVRIEWRWPGGQAIRAFIACVLLYLATRRQDL
jgi:hypothetical protein